MALLPAAGLLSFLHRSGCCHLGCCSPITASPKNKRGNRENTVRQRGRSLKNTTPGPGTRRWRRAMETSFFFFFLFFSRAGLARVSRCWARGCCTFPGLVCSSTSSSVSSQHEVERQEETNQLYWARSSDWPLIARGFRAPSIGHINTLQRMCHWN